MLDENAALGRTTGNPCYEDQMEGVALFAKGRSLFLFNAILNAKHQFLRMFAGDYIAAHKEACKFVDEVYEMCIRASYTILVMNTQILLPTPAAHHHLWWRSFSF